MGVSPESEALDKAVNELKRVGYSLRILYNVAKGAQEKNKKPNATHHVPKQQQQQEKLKQALKDVEDLRGRWRASMLQNLALEDELAQERARKSRDQDFDAVVDELRHVRDQLDQARAAADGQQLTLS